MQIRFCYSIGDKDLNLQAVEALASRASALACGVFSGPVLTRKMRCVKSIFLIYNGEY